MTKVFNVTADCKPEQHYMVHIEGRLEQIKKLVDGGNCFSLAFANSFLRLFESLIGKLTSYPELNEMLHSLLFTGRNIPYKPDEVSIDNAAMFGFIKKQHGVVAIANRIFETRLYNLYISSAEMQRK